MHNELLDIVWRSNKKLDFQKGKKVQFCQKFHNTHKSNFIKVWKKF